MYKNLHNYKNVEECTCFNLIQYFNLKLLLYIYLNKIYQLIINLILLYILIIFYITCKI